MSEAAAAVGISRLLSDERLTRRAVGGDERAFAAIFQRYHQSLYRFCLTIVGNPEDAQDALQNTMMKVLRALPGEERTIDLKPWLYRIAHNESIDLLRRRRDARQLDVEQAAPGYGLTEDVATRERLRQLVADLRELPERQREVLVMRELAGLGFEEIGAALETSGAVARQTLYEARQSLRQMEEGREMGCEAVRRALSDGDGRVARRRDVRAHLRSCTDCRSFGDAIKTRQRDLAALSPLPAVAAAGMLQGLIGGSAGTAAGGGLAVALGGGAAKTIGASAAAKGVATVAVAAAIGVTAADRTGVIHVGLPGGKDEKAGEAPAPGHPAHGGQGGANAGQQGGNGGGAASQGSQAGGKAPSSGKSAKANRGAANGKGKSKGNGRSAKVHPGVSGHGPQANHPSGSGREKQRPPAAKRGQETAEASKPPSGEPPAAAGGQSATPPQPPRPAPPSAPSASAKEPPAAPSAAPAPESQPRSLGGSSAAEAPAPAASNAGGKSAEKIP